eukprot:gb/GEZN01004695.1/.p1 GENE.gb/GEZN01004695.1/~~gb/GEZN01004695.1/.p1  ORF type:complete len:527 (+),score=68.23 gb/GEZN01004695.1/:32-1612(+)
MISLSCRKVASDQFAKLWVSSVIYFLPARLRSGTTQNLKERIHAMVLVKVALSSLPGLFLLVIMELPETAFVISVSAAVVTSLFLFRRNMIRTRVFGVCLTLFFYVGIWLANMHNGALGFPNNGMHIFYMILITMNGKITSAWYAIALFIIQIAFVCILRQISFPFPHYNEGSRAMLVSDALVFNGVPYFFIMMWYFTVWQGVRRDETIVKRQLLESEGTVPGVAGQDDEIQEPGPLDAGQHELGNLLRLWGDTNDLDTNDSSPVIYHTSPLIHSSSSPSAPSAAPGCSSDGKHSVPLPSLASSRAERTGPQRRQPSAGPNATSSSANPNDPPPAPRQYLDNMPESSRVSSEKEEQKKSRSSEKNNSKKSSSSGKKSSGSEKGSYEEPLTLPHSSSPAPERVLSYSLAGSDRCVAEYVFRLSSTSSAELSSQGNTPNMLHAVRTLAKQEGGSEGSISSTSSSDRLGVSRSTSDPCYRLPLFDVDGPAGPVRYVLPVLINQPIDYRSGTTSPTSPPEIIADTEEEQE